VPESSSFNSLSSFCCNYRIRERVRINSVVRSSINFEANFFCEERSFVVGDDDLKF
jgi:hypothetical protein